jgi:hypothetical protein
MPTLEEIVADPFLELSFFYRDSNPSEDIIAGYQPGKLLVEPIPVLLTDNPGGLTKSLRLCIASRDLRKVDIPGDNPNKWNAWSTHPFACFKILDKYEIDGQVQVLLLQVNEEFLASFQQMDPAEAQSLIDKARADFDAKVDADINMELEEEGWKQATASLPGLRADGQPNLLPPIPRADSTEAAPQFEIDEEVPGLLQATFDKIALFHRDTDLPAALLEKYQVGQILMERGFTDMSYKASGLAKPVRFAILSNDAKDLSKINPDVAKYGFVVLENNSFFKVIDIYKAGDNTQVLLLHFPAYGAAVMRFISTEIEKEIIPQVQKMFDESIGKEALPELKEEEWLNRTSFPVGMTDGGEFFLQ